MKIVFSTTQQVVDLWASQSQPEARTGSNTGFRGLDLFSYRTHIAALVPHRHGMGGTHVAMISESWWGTTTAIVLGQARDACRRRNIPVFTVGKVGTAVHLGNMKRYEERIAETIGKIERAKIPQFYRDNAVKLIAEAAAYSAIFCGGGWFHDGQDPTTVLSKKEREART